MKQSLAQDAVFVTATCQTEGPRFAPAAAMRDLNTTLEKIYNRTKNQANRFEFTLKKSTQPETAGNFSLLQFKSVDQYVFGEEISHLRHLSRVLNRLGKGALNRGVSYSDFSNRLAAFCEKTELAQVNRDVSQFNAQEHLYKTKCTLQSNLLRSFYELNTAIFEIDVERETQETELNGLRSLLCVLFKDFGAEKLLLHSRSEADSLQSSSHIFGADCLHSYTSLPPSDATLLSTSGITVTLNFSSNMTGNSKNLQQVLINGSQSTSRKRISLLMLKIQLFVTTQ